MYDILKLCSVMLCRSWPKKYVVSYLENVQIRSDT